MVELPKVDAYIEMKRSPAIGEFCQCGSPKNKYGCIRQQTSACPINGSAIPESLMVAWEEANTELFRKWHNE